MGREKIPIDLIILDFDGTITDSIPSAVTAIQSMIKKLGLPYMSREEIGSHVGYGEVPLVSGSIGTKEPVILKKAMETYEDIYVKEGIKGIRLYPHVREFLEHFRDKTKIIISNKKDSFIRLILDCHQLSRYFREVHGGDTAPCLKPDPCVINDMLRKFSVPKERAVFIGDMTVDIETGKNAGIHTCAVTYGFQRKEELEKLGPDFLIDDILMLKDLIK